MLKVAEELRGTVDRAMPLLEEITDDNASIATAPGKWSRKEILGHLIDSAGNNQQKFVRLMETPQLDFVGYHQNHWVDSQKYNAADWRGLIALWRGFNMHIAHIIEHVEPGALANSITIDDDGGPYTLEFIMTDYVRHMEHHLSQILPGGPFSSPYSR